MRIKSVISLTFAVPFFVLSIQNTVAANFDLPSKIEFSGEMKLDSGRHVLVEGYLDLVKVSPRFPYFGNRLAKYRGIFDFSDDGFEEMRVSFGNFSISRHDEVRSGRVHWDNPYEGRDVFYEFYLPPIDSLVPGKEYIGNAAVLDRDNGYEEETGKIRVKIRRVSTK